MNTPLDYAEAGRVLDEAYRCVQLVRLHVPVDLSGRSDDELRETQREMLQLARMLGNVMRGTP